MGCGTGRGMLERRLGGASWNDFSVPACGMYRTAEHVVVEKMCDLPAQ